MDTQDFHLGDDNPESVTPYDEATSKAIAKREAAAERKRIERERRKAAPIIHETADWRLFLDPETLPQKAGCQPDDIGALVLKELVDNALDAGASVTLRYSSESRLWIVADNGPGLDPDDVPRLFCVNRPLLSSKLKRMPTRGMLGNGLRVVMAWAQKVFVTSRGVFQRLEVDQTTGHTIVTHRDNVPMEPGMTVEVRAEDPDDNWCAKKTIRLAELVSADRPIPTGTDIAISRGCSAMRQRRHQPQTSLLTLVWFLRKTWSVPRGILPSMPPLRCYAS